jgi:DNA-binding transcriptional regulator LsrR (DeoR family)
VGANLKKNHSNLNEPIIEEEEEKEELNSKRIISETIKKRRKASMHIESNVGRFSQNKSLLYQNDPIYEEVEESDELNSENNFYIQWD